MMIELDDRWDRWMRDNLARGVPGRHLIERMVRAGFDPADALAALVRRTPMVPPTHEAAHLALVAPEHDPAPTLLMSLTDPRVRVFANVLSPETCVDLINLASTRMEAATTVDADTGAGTLHLGRRAGVAMFQPCETPLIEYVDRRASALLALPIEFGEGLQIVRYGPGGEYRPHFDCFVTNRLGGVRDVASGEQRVATLILYLNDVTEGGETIFPELSLTISPHRGYACSFHYLDERGDLDSRTLHGGAPVLGGEKWIATKWMRAAVPPDQHVTPM